MTEQDKPFKFDFTEIFSDSYDNFSHLNGSVSINLPFISFSFEPKNEERNVAREILVKMSDRRVLISQECCDNCIQRSINSLLEIREFLVNKQMEISHLTDSPIYILIELQVEAIRQFLTFEEKIKSQNQDGILIKSKRHDGGSSLLLQEQYFSSLEILRSHIHKCLNQISKIAKIEVPKNIIEMDYDESWRTNLYTSPEDESVEWTTDELES